MKLARPLVVAAVVASLVVGLVVDANDRPTVDVAVPVTSGVPIAQPNGVWFCPGGSDRDGLAEVAIELINVGSSRASAVVSGVRNGDGLDPRELTETLDVGQRRTVPLGELVPESAWMGAVVEVRAGDLVVEQTYVGDGEGADRGVDRAPCHSRTATSWIVASGATREVEFGERMTLLVLNPFLEDAVLDITFDSDVGVDSLPGVVVPAQRVSAIEINPEVTVAARVSAVIDVVAGRVAVSRLQVVHNDQRSGLTVTPASADAAPVWFLPVVRRDDRDDVITVVNPSKTETAEVDLEIVADGDTSFDPVLLTIRPGRAVQVPLADETRLDGLREMSVVARSLTGLPVAVMNESSLLLGDGPVTNLSATVGADSAATRWVAPLEADAGGIVIYNPSATGIASARVAALVAGESVTVADVELAPLRRAVISADEILAAGDAATRPIALVESTEPVVVGRELSDVSLHAQMVAIISGADPVPLG